MCFNKRVVIGGDQIPVHGAVAEPVNRLRASLRLREQGQSS